MRLHGSNSSESILDQASDALRIDSLKRRDSVMMLLGDLNTAESGNQKQKLEDHKHDAFSRKHQKVA